MSINSGKRAKVILYIFISLFILLSSRIYFYQYVDSKKLAVMADTQYSYQEKASELNYSLLDYNGNDLLKYKIKYYCAIIPDLFIQNDSNDKSEQLLAFMYILRDYNNNYDLSGVTTAVESGKKLYYEIDENTYKKLQQIKGVKGFYVYTYSAVDRSEPWDIENLISNSRTLLDGKLKAATTLESQINSEMDNNKSPQMVFDKDINGNIAAGKLNVSSDNLSVRLTLDKNIQDKVYSILNSDKYKKYSQAGVVLMKASTGEIRSCMLKDGNEPNAIIGASTNHGYYPGSIFKVIVAEAGINSGIISTNDLFTCLGHYEEAGSKEHGTMNIKQALTISDNDIFAQIGCRVGFDKFGNLAKLQGLDDKVLNLSDEVNGAFEIKKPLLSDGTLSISSIGQLNRITPLEAISIPNTVVNEGTYIKPYILGGYYDKNNNAVKTFSSDKKNVISTSTAEIMKEDMINVVKNGTGTQAAVSNIEVGGKTGTTQRVEKDSKGINVTHSDGWFSGFFKINNDYYSMVVFVEDINNVTESGGNTAAPIFHDVLNAVKNIIK